MAWLLGRHSDSYASNQYRALQQFFTWLSAEEGLADPMDGLHPPKVAGRLVPVFTAAELLLLECACAGRGFAERRDAAIIAVLKASGIRLSELAGICYDAHTSGAATSTCGSGRSGCAARAAGPGSSRSATTLPGPWTATCVPVPAIRRPGGHSCGSVPGAEGR